MSSRPPYSGSESKLVISIDIGTTYSGASYTFLSPGEVPKVYNVIGFKGQEHLESNTKVPSVLLYDGEGKLVACGAEVKAATEPFMPQGHIRTEWFKLKLRPASMRIDTPPITLPPKRTLIEVFGDFLRYMYDCVREYIVKTHAEGEQIWVSLHNSAHFILSHPNGWESLQQRMMRQAAMEGGLVPKTSEGEERVEFVTEGEASFHWCVEEKVAEKALKEGTKIVVADLGGGTIDVSSFRVVDPKPLRLEETPLCPDCVVAGSITVTDRFVKTIQARLQNTPYGDQDSMETLREEFDNGTKCHFRSEADKPQYVRIGGRRDNHKDDLCKIEYGILEVQRKEVEQAFEPSIKATVQAIKKHVDGQPNVVRLLIIVKTDPGLTAVLVTNSSTYSSLGDLRPVHGSLTKLNGV
ncbi:hypothetical protein FRC01_004911 [Tulasnella sp. 417]|nr:hypothetical protein FRC01_004911 [Tulasnella sp. 417]